MPKWWMAAGLVSLTGASVAVGLAAAGGIEWRVAGAAVVLVLIPLGMALERRYRFWKLLSLLPLLFSRWK